MFIEYNETVGSNLGRRRRRPKENNVTTVSDDDVLLLLSMPYSFVSLTGSFLFVLPAGGVFQTEPPGGCLRQAFEFGTYNILLLGGMPYHLSSSQNLRESVRIHCGYALNVKWYTFF